MNDFVDVSRSFGVYAHLYEGDTILVPEENRWNHSWVEKNILPLIGSGGNPSVCQKYRDK